MIEWSGYQDSSHNIPVHSLYGEVRKPTASMLEGIDTMIIDLFDVGARYYTFIWTAFLTLKACSELGIRVVVLDRPNPLNGLAMEGPLLDGNYRSFVGLHPLVMRHGMTMGELLTMFREEEKLSVPLTIVPMEGWTRRLWFDELSLPWVMPSPNMPTLDTATVYPGFCLLEGTMISEGRGTTRPFELFGAPYIDSYRLVEELAREKLPGVHFRPASFEPTFQKCSRTVCGGAQVHVTDRETFSSVLTVTAVLKSIIRLYGERFTWKSPPYEYEYDKMPFDILAGSDALRQSIEKDRPLREIEEEWREDVDAFEKRRRPFLLYEPERKK